MKCKLYIIAALLLTTAFCQAQTTWTGSANTNWNDAANWSSGVPNNTTTAIIPAAGTVTNWPKLNVDANVAALTMGEGSSMDVNGFFITIFSGGLNLNGGTLPITISNSSTVTNIAFTSAAASTGNWLIGNVIFTDQVVYSIMGTGIFYDGYTGGATEYQKDVSYIIQNTGNAFICTYFPNVYEGNVGVIRNAAASASITNVFVSGHAGIAGHFTLNNTVGGITNINPSGGIIDTIQGAVNITVGRSGSLQHDFAMQGVINNSGGNIFIANVTKLILSGNTLNAPVSISGLSLSTENTIRGNRITGNFSIENTSGTHALINTGGNKFTGNATFNLVGGELNTGYTGFGADTINGNTAFTLGDEERLVESHSFKNKYNGNLTVTRTGNGNTYLFKSGHDGISGNLSITNTNINAYGGGGVIEINPDGVSMAAIQGTVDVNLEAIRPNDLWFTMRAITNNTAGGEIQLTNATKINFVNNLLRADFIISGLEGSTENNFFGNNISGNFSLESTTGNHAPVYLGSNLLTGNTSFNLSGGQLFTGYTGYGADIYTGNTTITLGTGETLNESHGYPNKYNGNLTVTRTGEGNINLFMSGHAGISGNFSFTNLHGNSGEDYINRNNNPTAPIQGTINIDVNLGTTGIYQLFQMKGMVNNTAGGTINIANQIDVSLQNNTLKADIAITSLRLGNGPVTINGNIITGNFLLNNLDGIQVFTGGNQFNGTTSFTLSTGRLFTGYTGLGAETYNGNTNITIGSWTELAESYDYGNQYNGSLTVTRTGLADPGIVTILFNTGHVAISGDFTFSNPHGGYTALNEQGSASALIQGTVNIDVANAGRFIMQGVSNNTAGGSVNINNCGWTTMTKDTLQANVAITNINITGVGNGVFYKNQITGNFTLSDAATNTVGIYTGGNTINGATTYTSNSAASFNTSAGSQGNDIHNGSFTLTRNGTGSFNIAQDDDVEWNGDVMLNYPSFVNYNPANKIIIGGSSNSSIVQLGTADILIPNLQLNKSSGTALTLNSPLYISNNLTFTNGIIKSSASNFLQLNNNATVIGASAASHVNGVVQKEGDDAFTFPIGTATTYNPVAITAPANASDVFRAVYNSGNPYNPASHAPTVASVSSCEHWDVNRINGSSNVTLTFTYDQPCAGPGYITNPANVHIVHWNNTSWDDLGNGGYTGGLTGTVTTAGPVSAFSPFTLASTDIVLPLKLLSFNGKKVGNVVSLNWQTIHEVNVSHFEIERSSDGATFTKIGVVNAVTNSSTNNYNYIDAAPQNGTNYYRLKMVDIDGRFEFSKIVNVHFSSEHSVKIYPVPASSTITLQNVNQFKQLEIVDMQGRILLSKNISQQNETINIAALAKGMYFIKLSNDIITVSEKFVKE